MNLEIRSSAFPDFEQYVLSVSYTVIPPSSQESLPSLIGSCLSFEMPFIIPFLAWALRWISYLQYVTRNAITLGSPYNNSRSENIYGQIINLDSEFSSEKSMYECAQASSCKDVGPILVQYMQVNATAIIPGPRRLIKYHTSVSACTNKQRSEGKTKKWRLLSTVDSQISGSRKIPYTHSRPGTYEYGR